jgi:hypothetical protein
MARSFEVHHTLIGVVTLARRCNDSTAFAVIVDPARRKLRIDGGLLDSEESEASSSGLRRLTARYPSDALAADASGFSLFLTAHRRAEGRVTTIPSVSGTG